jgi:hypothetical protein
VSNLQPPPGQVDLVIETKVSPVWFKWFIDLIAPINKGLSVTVTTAKLTGGGANGSMTFVNGILTAQTPAT